MGSREDMSQDDNFDELNTTLTEESQPSADDSAFFAERFQTAELLTRLAVAEKKIEQCEQSMYEIMQSTKCDVMPIDEYSSIPKDIKEEAHSVVMYIQEHIKKLEEQFNDLDNADMQIAGTTDKVLQEIDDTYDQLKSMIIQEINKKRDLMRLEAQVFKSESLVPLKACRNEISAQISHKKQSIVKIHKALQSSQASNMEIYELLNNNRNTGGIPAVPQPEELPYLTFKNPSSNKKNEVLNKVYDLGSVLRLGPAEIVDIEEKPASVFVKWDITDPEYAGEEQIFVLQKAIGEVLDPTDDKFETVYEGPETCCFVRKLLVNQPITLRVGIQSLDSAWSAPRITTTHLSIYRWNDDNKDYMITNNGRIATKIMDNLSTVFSHGAQLDANQVIEFKLLEAPKNGSNDEGVALIRDPQGGNDNFRRRGTLLITPQGKIVMDGNEKLMQLPRMHVGAKIVVTIHRKSSESVRINIESADKAVTYDWVVQTPLHFAARFAGSKWSVMVK